MVKSTKRMGIGDESNKKLQSAMMRANELRVLASRMSSDGDIDLVQGLRHIASELTSKARKSARKVEAISRQLKSRRLDSGGESTSKFGNLVGKMGQIAGRPTPEKAAEVIDDAARPMVKQMLETSKGVLDAMDKAANHAMEGLDRV